MTTAENIFKADDLRREEVEEWGQTFYIQELSAFDVQKIQEYESGSMKQTAAYVIAASVYENGQRLFQWQDMEKLLKKNFRKLQELAVRVLEFNGLGEEASEALEGNSEPTPSE